MDKPVTVFGNEMVSAFVEGTGGYVGRRGIHLQGLKGKRLLRNIDTRLKTSQKINNDLFLLLFCKVGNVDNYTALICGNKMPTR